MGIFLFVVVCALESQFDEAFLSMKTVNIIQQLSFANNILLNICLQN